MREKVIAVAYGTVCHVAFLVAILLMAYDTYFGFTRALWPIGGEYGRWWNIALVLQFPVVHSVLLTTRGRRFMAWLAPAGIGDRLTTTTFAIISSLQLGSVFLLWTPTETVWFRPSGGVGVSMTLLFIGAWLLLGKAIWDASIALHTGFLGWNAVFRGDKPRFRPPPDRGTYRVIRQPIYLAFALILLTGPVWSPDHLFFLMVWGGYCVIGPLFKEKRLLLWYGERYRRYQSAVPYMLPRIGWRFWRRRKNELEDT